MRTLIENNAEYGKLISSIPLSNHLLGKDLLLTPKLKRHFGQIKVVESSILERIETDCTYLRESILYQTLSGDKLLEATLRILKKKLPRKLIEDLQSTSIPFGDLLFKYEIFTEVKNRQIILCIDPGSGSLQMGRSHVINELGTNNTLCFVKELLVPEESLIESKIKFMNQN